jgi:vanillate O-demethylase ferredoxin subunit
MEASDNITQGKTQKLSLIVRQIRFEANGINSYELVHPQGLDLPSFSAGAHIDIHVNDRFVRQYSLCNNPADRKRYVIAVLRETAGRGGSEAVHDTVRVQDRVTVSHPRNNFQLVDAMKKAILIAGGIGVTPLKSMAHDLESRGIDYELHYCAKDPACVAFSEEFHTLAAKGRVKFHFDEGDPAKSLDIAKLLSDRLPGTHVYYCGPGGFMNACALAASEWPAGTVHSEHFKAPIASTGLDQEASGPSGGFSVQIASTGQNIVVPAEQSLVEALECVGIGLDTSCLSGLCGTCKLEYLSGEVDHQDFILGDEERERFLTACVSRGKAGTLVLNL